MEILLPESVFPAIWLHPHGHGPPGSGLARARALVGADGQGRWQPRCKEGSRGECGQGDGEGEEPVLWRFNFPSAKKEPFLRLLVASFFMERIVVFSQMIT